MKRLLIELDDNYANAITITAIGGGLGNTNISTVGADLRKTDKIIIDENGKAKLIMGENNE